MSLIRRKENNNRRDLSLDEIFIDASNLPDHNEQQFEGRLEKMINRRTFYGLALFCLFIFLILIGRVFWLAVIKGNYYAERSLNNSLDYTPIFAERGNISDRLGKELAWTGSLATTTSATDTKPVADNGKQGRVYISDGGFGHLLGYVSFPNEAEFKTGQYNAQELLGRDGVERQFNDQLLGQRGTRIVEVNAKGSVISDHVVQVPIPGQEITLSIDSRIQSKLYELIKQSVADRGFSGGAGAIIDVKTGEILALTSYPDYDPNVFSVGQDKSLIKHYLTDKSKIMLDRAVGGLYTPGSVFKPFMALAALNEKIVDPLKTFVTHGQLEIPNPYDKTKTTIFKDWRDNGVVDMRKGIEESSDVYFYIIGGGFGGQKGLGIANIEKYAKLFGLSQKTGINLPGEEDGFIPSPEWKAKNFNGEAWRLGDTYHTVIGQYGVLITPIQIARAYAAIANNGKLIQPTILKSTSEQAIIQATIPIASASWQVVHEGMRDCVIQGTAKALNTDSVAIAAKTGTAELGVSKENVNSWVSGFWPYDNPRFAFAIVMEKGSRTNLVGAAYVMRQLVDWMAIYTPEYLSSSPARP